MVLLCHKQSNGTAISKGHSLFAFEMDAKFKSIQLQKSAAINHLKSKKFQVIFFFQKIKLFTSSQCCSCEVELKGNLAQSCRGWGKSLHAICNQIKEKMR